MYRIETDKVSRYVKFEGLIYREESYIKKHFYMDDEDLKEALKNKLPYRRYKNERWYNVNQFKRFHGGEGVV